ncbi:MAG: type II toxin-antitoxin system RelE/ParE family toxin [Gemmatimonadota bacterium]
MNVIWSPLAIERVLEIAEWIATDRPGAADRSVERIFGAAERLGDFPESGRAAPEFERPELQEVIQGKWRIVHRTSSDAVEILTVRPSLEVLDGSELESQKAARGVEARHHGSPRASR